MQKNADDDELKGKGPPFTLAPQTTIYSYLHCIYHGSSETGAWPFHISFEFIIIIMFSAVVNICCSMHAIYILFKAGLEWQSWWKINGLICREADLELRHVDGRT